MFNRPPRFPQKLETIEVDIPGPPVLRDKPRVSWIALVMPLLGGVLVVVLVLTVFGGSGGTSILLFLPILALSAIASIVTSLIDQRNYRHETRTAYDTYEEILNKKEEWLTRKVSKQQNALCKNDPDVETCVDWAESKNQRLGERRPWNDDFLSVRIGTGEKKSFLKIKPPDESGSDVRFHKLYQKANNLKEDFSWLLDVPIPLPLRETGSLGICGPREGCRQLARAYLMHLATHHWVQELELMVLCSSVKPATDWQWVDSLPHKTNLFKPSVIELTTDTAPQLKTLEEEMLRRQSLRYQAGLINNTSSDRFAFPAIVVVFDHVENIYQNAAFTIILESGRSLSVYGIFLQDSFQDIPGECGALISLTENDASVSWGELEKAHKFTFTPDRLLIPAAEKFATALGSISWQLQSAASEPPNQLTLLNLFDAKTPTDLPIAKWWDGAYPYGYLRVPIGRITPSADMIFDLNETSEKGETHGPHGVIGGMTGSGKSELLRSMILSLALTHHPYDINFALIDYKGGGAFKDLEQLPHVVGVITDIESHGNYASRVIEALSGEVRTRKEILADAVFKFKLNRFHIDDYRKLPVRRPLPRLIIIFDEYAEFKDQHPAAALSLINIARQGRSLGMHLILCTQNPSSAVDQQVRQNSKFRISLSVSSPDDSRELIGIPDGFGLSVGEAYMFVKSPKKFRAAFTGGEIGEGKDRETEARSIAASVIACAESLVAIRPPKVWPEPLPAQLFLPRFWAQDEVIGRRPSWNGSEWVEDDWKSGAILGSIDDPYHQNQPFLDYGGQNSNRNLLVFGGAQSGKSTLILSLAYSIAHFNSPDIAHIYCLDLGGQSLLYKVGELPHTPNEGGVIVSGDKERIGRLLSLLRTEIGARRRLFQESGDFPDFESFLKSDPGIPLPALYLFIDGLTRRFTESMANFNDQLVEILLEGQSVGIFVVITTTTIQDVDSRVYSYMSEKIVLRPLDKSQLDILGAGSSTWFAQIYKNQGVPPGRGFIRRSRILEFQVALPVIGDTDQEIASALTDVAEKMRMAWRGRPRPTPVLSVPVFLSLSRLKEIVDKKGSLKRSPADIIPLGISGENLQPVGFSISTDGPAFLVASNGSRKGKTVFLQTWLLELAGKQGIELTILDYHSHSLRHMQRLPGVLPGAFVHSQLQLSPALDAIRLRINRRKNVLETLYREQGAIFNPDSFLREKNYLVVVIDDYDLWRKKTSSDLKQILLNLLIDGEDCGFRLILAENTGALGYPSQDPLVARVGLSSCGVLLGGADGVETYYNQAPIPYQKKMVDFPLGRGYWINRRPPELIQTAAFWSETRSVETPLEEILTDQLDQLLEKYPSL